MATLSHTLATIPYEVTSQILQLLDIPSLKQCRLTNHALLPAASSTLFSSIHITTTVTSLNHAISIARSPDLSSKAQSFTYHASTLVSSPRGSLDETTGTATYTNPADFAACVADGPGNALALFPGHDALTLWQEFTAIYAARRDLESHGYVSSRLRSLLRLLPNVNAVGLRPVTPEAPFIPSEHIQVLSRVDEDAFTDLLTACAEYEGIRSLTAERLHWGSFRACNDLTRFCSGLRDLDLRIDDRGIGYPYSYMRREFVEFLGLCHNLKSLVLHLDAGVLRQRACNFRTYFEAIKAVSCDVLGVMWRRLERVSLLGFTTSEEQLTCFFENHRASLQKMRLVRLGVLWPDRNYVNVDSVTWDNASGSESVMEVIRSTLLLKEATGFSFQLPP